MLFLKKKVSVYVLKLYDKKPLVLGAKEGLALLNGTQFMCAFAIDQLNPINYGTIGTKLLYL